MRRHMYQAVLLAADVHEAVYLARALAFLAGEHEVDDAKPVPQIDIGVFEDGPGDIGEAISPALTAIGALPMPLAGLEGIDASRVATRAMDAIWLAVSDRIGVTRILIGERLFPFRDHRQLGQHPAPLYRCCCHVTDRTPNCKCVKYRVDFWTNFSLGRVIWD